MKNAKRFSFYFITLLILFILVSASVFCEGQKEERETPAAGSVDKLPGEADIKWFFRASNSQLPKDCFIVNKIKEDLNINFTHIKPKTDDYNESLNLLLASGSVPDIITTNVSYFLKSKLIADGVAAPIEDYLTEEHVPNLIRISNNWDTALEYVTVEDGHIYSIPRTNNRNVSVSAFIRKDWLANLSMDVPGNLEELKNVLKSFTTDDPDRNGKDDTVGTIFSEAWMAMDFAEIMGSCPYRWYQNDEGKLTLGCYLDKHKEFFKYARDLINSGALFKESITTSWDQLHERLDAGKVGFLYTWNELDNKNLAMRKHTPEANWKPIPPIKGAYDKGYLPGTKVLLQEHVVTRKADKDAVFRLINYLSDDTSTEEVSDYTGNYWYMKFGEKGKNWDVINGKMEVGYNDEEIRKQNEIDKWSVIWMRVNSKFDFAYLDNMTKEWKDAYKELESYPTFADIPKDTPGRPIDLQGVTIPDEAATFVADSNLKWEEVYAQAILTNKDIDQLWDDFVKEMENVGLRDIEDTMTEIAKKYGRIK
jgi:ABC-type glycerol-3-phosphate transport system substrate-binding protein